MKRSTAIILIPLILFAIVAFIFFYPHQRSRVQKSDKIYTVSRVIDGTTLELEGGERVALLGVVAPKPRDLRLSRRLSEEHKLPLDRVRKYAFETRYFMKDLVVSRPVRLEFDPKNAPIKHRDPAGRLLAYVWVTYEPSSVNPPDWMVFDFDSGSIEFGTQLNGSMIRGGYAFADHSAAYKYDKEFVQFQKEARENARGIWSNGAA